MADLLKDIYNYENLYAFAQTVQSVYNAFQVTEFLACTMDETWEDLALKARARKISKSLGAYLPAEYAKALAVLDKVVADFSGGFFGIIFPDYVEVYGQKETDWDISVNALERYTQYSSSEFAVRPFIINNEARMMAQMYAWAKHDNDHVRRLASEGCRPALPWAQAINSFKKDPTPVLPVLEQLKTDSSLYVRKSVANNLNDISKTHPDLVAELAKDWYGKHKYTDWIVKHGCRTLLKKGNPQVLGIFGYEDAASIDISGFRIGAVSVLLGEALTFSFSIAAKEETKVRLEYGIDYVKANGKRNRKIFQISESLLKANQAKFYEKAHAFADLSTRKHYPGLHSITLIVNGKERGSLNFELVK